MSVRLIVFEKIDFDHIAQTNLSRPLRGQSNHLEVVKVIQYFVPWIASTQYDIKITVEGSEPGRLYIA